MNELRLEKSDQKKTAGNLVEAYLSDKKLHPTTNLLSLLPAYLTTPAGRLLFRTFTANNAKMVGHAILANFVKSGSCVLEGTGESTTVRLAKAPSYMRGITQRVREPEELGKAEIMAKVDQGGGLITELQKGFEAIVRPKLQDTVVPDVFVFALLRRATGIEIEKRNIVIAPTAEDASRAEPLSRLGHAHRARMYGLQPLNRQMAPYDKDVVRLLFGFQEMTIHKHGLVPTKIEVVQLHNGGGMSLPEKISPTELKRSGIWQNSIRNRRIAHLARCLVNRSALVKSFPRFAEALNGRSSLAILILVENAEHGTFLARRLPGWPLVAAGTSWLTAPYKGSDTLQPIEPIPSATQVISTWEGVQLMTAHDWDVVIRADGGVGVPSILESAALGPILYCIKNLPSPPEPATEAEPILYAIKNLASPQSPGVEGAPIVYAIKNVVSQPSLLLVDFRDQNHPVLRRWSRQRRAAYAERGWYAPGVDPVQARIDRFLATRPQSE